MEHHFDVELAKEFGILEAILLNNIFFWIEHNKANEVNFYDGDYWTFNSTRAFAELIPYASQRQIQLALKHLISEGILKTGNYNKTVYDRTLWYAFTEKGNSIMQKCKMEDLKMLNRNVEKGKPIPDNKPYNKTQIKNTDTESDVSLHDTPPKEKNVFEEVVSVYNECCSNLPKVKVLTEKRKTSIRKFLKELTVEQLKEICQKANESSFLIGDNGRGWKADFDFIMRVDKASEILEGRFDNSDKAQNKPVSEEFKEKMFEEEKRRREELEASRTIDLSKYGIII